MPPLWLLTSKDKVADTQLKKKSQGTKRRCSSLASERFSLYTEPCDLLARAKRDFSHYFSLTRKASNSQDAISALTIHIKAAIPVVNSCCDVHRTWHQMIRDWYVKKLDMVQTKWMLWETAWRKPTSWYLLISRMFFSTERNLASARATGVPEKPSASRSLIYLLHHLRHRFLSAHPSSPCFQWKVFPLLLLHSLHFYRICVFFLTRRPSQAAWSSAGDEQQPFPPMSHCHANGKPIQSSFVDAAATAPPGPSLFVCSCCY